MSETILRLEGLTVGYGKKEIVKDILAEVRRGEISCLIGPNGTGKTTILRTLIRELLPLAGTVLLAVFAVVLRHHVYTKGTEQFKNL